MEPKSETRQLAWMLRNAGWTVGEISAEICVTATEVARMLLGELAGTLPQRAKMKALCAVTRLPQPSTARERAGPP